MYLIYSYMLITKRSLHFRAKEGHWYQVHTTRMVYAEACTIHMQYDGMHCLLHLLHYDVQQWYLYVVVL